MPWLILTLLTLVSVTPPNNPDPHLEQVGVISAFGGVGRFNLLQGPLANADV